MYLYEYEEEHLSYAYECARRFDEGEACQTDEFSDIVKRKTAIFDLIIAKYTMYGDDLKKLLYEYENAFYDEMELEAMHFFREGYIAGVNERGGPMNDYRLPYKRLRELRIENDLTQEEVAKYLDVKLSMYQKFETGERDYTISVLLKLVKLYGTTSNYLLGWNDDK